jgi:hypothetical protein
MTLDIGCSAGCAAEPPGLGSHRELKESCGDESVAREGRDSPALPRNIHKEQ